MDYLQRIETKDSRFFIASLRKRIFLINILPFSPFPEKLTEYFFSLFIPYPPLFLT